LRIHGPTYIPDDWAYLFQRLPKTI
jgi:hypothetical protein